MENEVPTPQAGKSNHPGAHVAGDVSTAGGDFIGRDQLVQGDVVRGDKITTGGLFSNIGVAIGQGAQSIVNIVAPDQDQVAAHRDRAAMLAMVKQFWVQGVLEKSLDRGKLIQLNLSERPDAVDNRAWSTVIQTPFAPQMPATPPTTIAEAFYALNELTRTLLVLGAPGSGKTILLLDLARLAIERAEHDYTLPIPVVFNLASWTIKQQVLTEWLVDELNDKYYVARNVSRSWIEKNQLLLLLDGLDEVLTAAQNDCVQAINAFRAEHKMPIVVCCRVEQYEALTSHLQFQRALLVQPLTLAQIEDQLQNAAGDKFAELLSILHQDRSLQEMAQNPLMLNTMVQAFHEVSLTQWQGLTATTVPLHALFNSYIQRMFYQHGSPTQLYPQAQTVHRLIWLAQQMQQHTQAVFLIERMQPGWLATKGERWMYAIGTRFVYGSVLGALFAGLILLTGGLILGINLYIPRAFILPFTLSLLKLWVYAGVALGGVEILLWSLPQALPVLHKYALKTSLYGLVIGLLFGWEWNLFYGLLFGTLGSLFLVFENGALSAAQEIHAVERIQFSWRRALRGVLMGLLAGALLGGVLDLVVGGQFFKWLLPNLPFPFARFIAAGLLFGPLLAMFGIIFGGFHGVLMDTQMRPNQGMIFSARNALVAGAICILFGWGLGFAYAFVGHRVVPVGWTQLRTGGPLNGLAVGLLFGVLAGLWHGGFEVIKHSILRFLLFRAGHIAWHYARFLDYAAERIFLRKVGGGYIFVHRLLMEHFATLDASIIERITASKTEMK